MAESLIDILGISKQEAESYFEMAGGDLETAISMYYEMGTGGGMAVENQPTYQGEQTPSVQYPPWYSSVWPERKAIDKSWLEQGINFSEREGERVGLTQLKNGPCGILAALNAIVISIMFKKGQRVDLNVEPKDELLAEAMAAVLLRARSNNQLFCQVVEWTGEVGGAVNLIEVPEAKVEQHILNNISTLKVRGGCVLFLYSLIHTRGIDQIKKDIVKDGGELPLVYGMNWLCTTELMGILICGQAKGNVSAYNTTGDRMTYANGVNNFGIGLLSNIEIEGAGVPVNDVLKCPQYPIYILHGGDHFTLLFDLEARNEEEREKNVPFEMFHWNGLPPLGPRMCKLSIIAPSGARAKNPEKYEATFYKPEAGEIDDVVQPDKNDMKERPKQWKTWNYEVVLAIDDPEVEGVKRPADVPSEPKFELGQPEPGPWRCANCYRGRYQTMCFGQNEDTSHCRYCEKSKQDAGWSLWMHYNDLPAKSKGQITRRNAPKIVQILQTKWPRCDVIPFPNQDDFPGC
jgi:hypothetical protein